MSNKTIHIIIISLLYILLISCKKDKPDNKVQDNIITGTWDAKKYSESGQLIGNNTFEIIQKGSEVTGYITNCPECINDPQYIENGKFNNNVFTANYPVQGNGIMYVSASLIDTSNKKLDGLWNDNTGNGGDWIANKQ